jgi:hypothetical protein
VIATMPRSRLLGSIAAAGLGIGLGAVPCALFAPPPAHAEEVQKLRPAVGVPLQKAQELLKAGRLDDAAAQVGEADQAGDKTAYESFVIERMRGAHARAAGDNAAAARSYEAQLASGRIPAAAQLTLVTAIATMAYQAKDYAKTVVWITRYVGQGGKDPAMRALLIQAYFLQDDYADAAKVQVEQIAAAEQAGQRPSEAQLQMLAACYTRLKDERAFMATMERLAVLYQKSEYWAPLIHAVEVKAGFASDRLALDVGRLKLAVGMALTAAQYMDMAERALAAGLTGEAGAILDKGFAAGVFGSGAEAARAQRLKDLVAKIIADDQHSLAGEAAARDSTALFKLGAKFASYGRFDQGIPVMDQAVHDGGLKRPDDARLHLGLAYLNAGQHAKAVAMLATVGGSDGAADLARLWMLQAGGS